MHMYATTSELAINHLSKESVISKIKQKQMQVVGIAIHVRKLVCVSVGQSFHSVVEFEIHSWVLAAKTQNRRLCG